MMSEPEPTIALIVPAARPAATMATISIGVTGCKSRRSAGKPVLDQPEKRWHYTIVGDKPSA